MATTQHRDYLAECILPLIGQNAAQLPCEEITGFLSMAGSRYSQELMVVGRAVNGWLDEGYEPSTLSDVVVLNAFAEAVFASVTDDQSCPMDWVRERWGATKKYNTKRSAFWRACREVIEGMGITHPSDESWASHLVWSNLYKIAPFDKGNPKAALQRIQRLDCIELLRQELEHYRPKRLLLLTGLDWAEPFLDALEATVTPTPFRFVKAVAYVEHGTGFTKVVVAVHPQGKPEADLVTDVIKAFQSI